MQIRDRFNLLTLVILGCVLAIPFLDARAEAQDAPAATEKLPLPKELFQKYIEITGGLDAYKKINARTSTGTFELVGANLKGNLTMYQTRPNKSLVVIMLPGIGEMKQGFNGTVGWSINPMQGAMLAQGKELQQAKIDASFDLMVDPMSQFKSAETIARKTFAGEDCYQVKLVSHDDDIVNFFYSVETGLFRGIEMTASTPVGNVKTTATSSDYKEFNGIKMATVTTISAMGQQQKLSVNEVTFDEIPAETFALPPAIKTLVEAQEKKQEAAEPSK